ncbi:MAG: ABC transporter ATP-binding protein [Verrucomicrobiota bacterium]
MNENNQTPPVIQAENLTKVFRDFWNRPKIKAVSDVSFHVEPGEVFGILGPNGSGKSTTIKTILGLLHPTSGDLSVFGQSPRDVKTKERIGYLPEESYIYPYLTAEETLHFFSSLFSIPSERKKERVEQLLEMIGLEHARSRPVGEFSKGMARRIGLAQALINDPDLVILDEPTSGLDPLGCRQVKDLILALAERGKTVLLSSHLLADVEDVCDRIAIFYSGRIQAMGSIDELLKEKGRSRLTLPDMKEKDIDKLLDKVEKTTGERPDVEQPRMNLEKFFLEVIDKARNESDPTGAGQGAHFAEYLSSEKEGDGTDG